MQKSFTIIEFSVTIAIIGILAAIAIPQYQAFKRRDGRRYSHELCYRS